MGAFARAEFFCALASPEPMAMRVFLSAGEPSGDHHAALLARALRERCPDVECVGLGGPQMAAEGVELVADMTKLASTGGWRGAQSGMGFRWSSIARRRSGPGQAGGRKRCAGLSIMS